MVQTIIELRRKLMLQARIASQTGVSRATVSRVLRRARMARLSDLAAPAEPIRRYEREAPGDLLHIDIKKLGRFTDVGHRITGDHRKRTRHIGWEHVFVAVDDHSRLAYTAIFPDERKASAIAFLQAAVAFFARMNVTTKRLITDNGPAFHSHAFGRCCADLGIAQSVLILGQRSPSENSAEDLRMKRLHPPVHHLRESRVSGYLVRLNP